MSINPNFKPMLLLTINNSIGDPSLHLNIEDLVSVFNKKPNNYTNIEKYAIDMIQTESTKDEFNNFINMYQIESEKASLVLSYNPYQ
tara:strand:+ start:243 stop:503 length:261 start_codon:yes stop_codon:yes gene_type:complete